MIKRKVLTRILIAGFTLSVVFGFIFVWKIQSLPHIAIAEINDLTNASVDVKSIDFKFDGSVLIKELVLRPAETRDEGRGTRDEGRGTSDETAILKADTVYARFGIGSLLLLRPRIKEIRIKNFVFDARYDSDIGRWNVAALKFNVQKDGAGKMPFIYLDGGTLQYSKVSNGQARVIAAAPIDMSFRPAEEVLGGYSFDIATAERIGPRSCLRQEDAGALRRGQSSSRSKLVGAWRPGRITLAGSISSAGIPAFQKAWVINVLNAELSYDRSGNFSLVFKAKDFLYTQETSADESGFDSSRRRLPATASSAVTSAEPERDRPAPALVFDKKTRGTNYGLFIALQDFFSRYRPEGKVDLDMKLSGSFNRLIESTLAGKVYCRDVSICDRYFPYSVEQITGQIDCTENSVILNNLAGKHGDTNVTFNGWVGDFGPNHRYQIQIKSDNMALDNDLYNALSVKQKRLWAAFSPSGQAAIDYRFSRPAATGAKHGEQSQTENKKTLVVELRGADFTYQDFCYPLRNLTGKLIFDQDNIIVSDVLSRIDDGGITFNGKISEYASRPVYYLSIKADNVPFDSDLAKALPVRQGNFFDRFDISGLADANAAIFTPIEEPNQISFRADLVLKKASLRINTFPLVLSDMSANVTLTPDSTGIKDATFRLDQSIVSLAGGFWMTNKALSSHYFLTLSASQAQLSDSLIGLLPTAVGKIISQWQPEGKVNLSGYLNKSAGRDQPDYKIAIDCLGDKVNFRTAKDGFYPLKGVSGRLTITNNKLMFDDITAVPAGIIQDVTEGSIKFNGQIDLADNAFNEGRFQLSARDISLGDYLVCSLPAGAVSFYQVLSPAGRFDLVLENVNIFNADEGGKYIDFFGAANFKDCNFNISGSQARLNAVMKIKALYKTKGGLANGQVSLIADSLKIKDKSITNVRGDFKYNPTMRNWEADDLAADCFGGRLSGKLEFKRPSDRAPAGSALTSDSEFLLQVGFSDIDLRRFLRGSVTADAQQAGYTSGTMEGSLSLDARIGDGSARLGRCRLAIRDMQVGRLSPLAKLLYVLQLKEQKDFAFEQMVVDSYLKKNMLYFEKFDLAGEAVAFSGTGWMDMQSENVNLSLTARGQRLSPIQSGTAEPSIMQSLAEGLGSAVVRMEVTGSVYDPKVETKALPLIGDSLKILGSPR